MTKTKRVEKTVRHVMEAMHHAVKDLAANGFYVVEAAKIVSDAALARMCILLVQAHGRPLFEANNLFADVKQLVHEYFTTPTQPTAPVVESEKPVRPVFEPDVPETKKFPVQENGPKQERPRTPAEILYPNRQQAK